MNELIGHRLKAARHKLGLTQAQLIEKLGFKDRQTLAAIEAGQRKVTAEELLRAINVLGVDIDYFTDEFRLVGEGRFSWRATKNASPKLLDQSEEKAGRWIATYWRLRENAGRHREPAASSTGVDGEKLLRGCTRGSRSAWARVEARRRAGTET